VGIHVGDRVRLRAKLSNAPAGTEGQVFGLYRRDGRVEVVVTLNGRVIIVGENELDVVAAAGASETPDR
jgi:exosome complex RNA-binding protein Rrp4